MHSDSDLGARVGRWGWPPRGGSSAQPHITIETRDRSGKGAHHPSRLVPPPAVLDPVDVAVRLLLEVAPRLRSRCAHKEHRLQSCKAAPTSTTLHARTEPRARTRPYQGARPAGTRSRPGRSALPTPSGVHAPARRRCSLGLVNRLYRFIRRGAGGSVPKRISVCTMRLILDAAISS